MKALTSLADAKDEIARLADEIAGLRRELADVESDLEDARKEAEDVENEAAQAERRMDALSGVVERLVTDALAHISDPLLRYDIQAAYERAAHRV